MTFLNPIGLAGLLSLPVILALHLLFRRQKRYVVSYLGLWTFLDAETRGPRSHRVPLTWILLLDLLLGALLSLAWSRPSVAVAQPEHAPRHWVILLDVSSSMRAADGAGSASRFAAAKDAAAALVREATPKDVITLLAFGAQPRIVADSRQGSGRSDGSAAEGQMDKAQLLRQLEQVQVGETGHSLPEALAMGQAALDPDLPAEFHVITDGSFPLPDADSVRRFAYPLEWHQVGGPADNQAVLELNATPLGGGRLQVFARFANFGSRPVTRQAVLAVDGSVLEQTSIILPPGSTVPHVWQISPAADGPAGSVTVSMQGSDPLAEDDTAAIGLQPGGTIRVALVAENLVPVQQAVQAVPNVDLRVIAPADYAGVLAQDPIPFDLTIFRGFIPDVWPSGQSLVIDPPGDSGSGGQAAAAQRLRAGSALAIPAGSLTQVSDSDPLVAGIDFSGIRWGRVWSLAGAQPDFVPVLQANGVPVLLRGSVAQAAGGARPVTVLLADLTQGNFTKHPAFPILMANLVDLARQAPLPAGFKTGEALPLPGPGAYRAVQITPPDEPPVAMNGSWPERWTDTNRPGLYRIQLTGIDGSRTDFTAGARAGDAVESDLRPRDWVQSIAVTGSRADSRAGQTDPGSDDPLDPSQRLDLRGWLLGAAVLVFLLEAILAWRR